MSMLRDLTLSEDQLAVLTEISNFLSITGSRRELRIGGLAGTGKTTMIAKFLNDSRQRIPYPISFATFTGKAAERLMHTFRSFGLEITVSTLHRILYLTVLDPIKNELRFLERDTLPEFIVVDEASMVSEDFYKMLKDPSKGVKKLVFVGDHGQLPPIVKEGETAFNLMENPTIKLEQIHRQCEGNPIIELAYAVRNAHSAHEVLDLIQQSPLRKISKSASFEGSIELSRTHSWNDIVHIVYKNATRVAINKTLCETNHALEAKDQPVIVLKNKHLESGVFLANGSRGLVKKFRHLQKCPFDVLDVEFPFGGLVTYLNAPREVWNTASPKTFYSDQELVPIDWAYAITCHKAQGSSWKHVFVWLNDVYRRDLDFFKRWVYTAITRTEQHIYFVL